MAGGGGGGWAPKSKRGSKCCSSLMSPGDRRKAPSEAPAGQVGREVTRGPLSPSPSWGAWALKGSVVGGDLATWCAFAHAQRRLGQLPLRPQRRDPGPREPERALVDQEARLPVGEELRVEPVEALDLEERIAQRDQLPEQPLMAPGRAVHPLGERREVQR